MGLQRACDSPACDVTVDVDPEQLEDLPAGWWLLERASSEDEVDVGELVPVAQYTLCSLGCVREVAVMFDNEPLNEEES